MAGQPPDVDGYLDELTAVLQTAIDRVRKMAIMRLRERAIERTLVASGSWVDERGRYATGPFQIGDPNLFTAEEWADMFQVDAVDVIGDVVVDTATRESLLVGGNISDDAIAEVVAAHMTKMRGIGDDVRASVSETLQLAARDRLSLDDTIRELAATGPLSADAARRWATTELHAAANGGMHAAWESAGVPFKRWRTSEDSRVRDAHENVDGQTVPTAMDFEVDGHPATFPGDPRLPIELRANCRCWGQPIDAAGRVRVATLADATRDDLRALATQLQIPGRGRMKKGELRAAIDRYLAGFGEQRIDTMTRSQLLRRARAASIVGRHQMTRRQLIGELVNPRSGTWRSDTGYVSREELSTARQRVAGRVTGRRQAAITVPPPDDPGQLRAEVVDAYTAPSGYAPCVSCGARLGTGAESASLARISQAAGWDVGNVAPLCRACARGLALFGGDLAALLHHQPAALVASPMQLSNPWHDDRGRFAPKGTGSRGRRSADPSAGWRTMSPGGRPGMGDRPLPDLDELRSSGEPHSLLDHIDPVTGQLTPQRQALHDRWIEDALAEGEQSPPPEMVFMGGGGGAGKSSVLGAGLVTKPHGSITINPDDLKELIPEVAAMQRAGDTSWARFSHEESSYLGKRLQQAAMERSVDVVMDAVGSDPAKVLAQMRTAREHGYSVELTYVSIPIDEGLRRAAERAANAVARGEAPRVIPPSIVRAAHVGANAAFLHVAGAADRATLVDNSRSTAAGRPDPLVIATVQNGQWEIADRSAWQDYLTNRASAAGPIPDHIRQLSVAHPATMTVDEEGGESPMSPAQAGLSPEETMQITPRRWNTLIGYVQSGSIPDDLTPVEQKAVTELQQLKTDNPDAAIMPVDLDAW